MSFKNIEILEIGLDRKISFLPQKIVLQKKSFADRPTHFFFAMLRETGVLFSLALSNKNKMGK